jgi:hypothetical protein
MKMINRSDALNDALERLDGYAYLDAPGFACHGPMGAETLSNLGHNDLVAGWVDQYRKRHQPLPPPSPNHPIDRGDAQALSSALGDPSRVSDWAAMFRAEFWTRPWQDVVKQWASRLLAGYGGALTHGLIRTAHAVRALSTEAPSSGLMLDELANGLALWAATFKVVPGRTEMSGQLTITEAIGRLPRPSKPWPLLEAGTFSRIDNLEGYVEAVDALGPPSSSQEALGALSAHFCAVIVANPDVFAVPLVHMVTPIAAVRTLLPYLGDVSTEQLYGQLWKVGAAITVSFTPGGNPPPAKTKRDPGSPDELLAKAVIHQDPHALKVSEACTREYALNPDPIYLTAAEHVLDQLPAW